jgi:GGDEF domain-containing protein
VAAALAAPVRVEGMLWGAVAVAYSEAGAAREEALVQLEVDRSAGDLYGVADAAMYRAKRSGRNRVRVA